MILKINQKKGRHLRIWKKTKVIDDSVSLPLGFKIHGIHCGVKKAKKRFGINLF